MESSQTSACWEDPVYTWHSSHKAGYGWGKLPGPGIPVQNPARVRDKTVKAVPDGVYTEQAPGPSGTSRVRASSPTQARADCRGRLSNLGCGSCRRPAPLGDGETGKGLLWWSLCLSHVSASPVPSCSPGSSPDSRWIRLSRNWLCFMISKACGRNSAPTSGPSWRAAQRWTLSGWVSWLLCACVMPERWVSGHLPRRNWGENSLCLTSSDILSIAPATGCPPCRATGDSTRRTLFSCTSSSTHLVVKSQFSRELSEGWYLEQEFGDCRTLTIFISVSWANHSILLSLPVSR